MSRMQECCTVIPKQYQCLYSVQYNTLTPCRHPHNIAFWVYPENQEYSGIESRFPWASRWSRTGRSRRLPCSPMLGVEAQAGFQPPALVLRLCRAGCSGGGPGPPKNRVMTKGVPDSVLTRFGGIKYCCFVDGGSLAQEVGLFYCFRLN